MKLSKNSMHTAYTLCQYMLHHIKNKFKKLLLKACDLQMTLTPYTVSYVPHRCTKAAAVSVLKACTLALYLQ